MTITEPRDRVARPVRVVRAAGSGGAWRGAAGALGRAVGADAGRAGVAVAAADALAVDGDAVADEEPVGRVAADCDRTPAPALVAPLGAGLLTVRLAGLFAVALAGLFAAALPAPAGVGVAPDAAPGAFTKVMPCPLAAAASRRDALACRPAADFFAMLFPQTLVSSVAMRIRTSAPSQYSASGHPAQAPAPNLLISYSRCKPPGAYAILIVEDPLTWPCEAGKEHCMALRAKPHIKRPGPLPETFTPFFLVGVKVFFCAPGGALDLPQGWAA